MFILDEMLSYQHNALFLNTEHKALYKDKTSFGCCSAGRHTFRFRRLIFFALSVASHTSMAQTWAQ